MNFGTVFEEVGGIAGVLGDVAAFASGQPVTAPPITLGPSQYSVSFVHLANGPVAPYQVISGSILTILGIVLSDYETIAQGGTFSIAEKIGNTWYGTMFTKVVPAAT
jgi:hypothetical protein